jgi:hypothetical protein
LEVPVFINPLKEDEKFGHDGFGDPHALSLSRGTVFDDPLGGVLKPGLATPIADADFPHALC